MVKGQIVRAADLKTSLWSGGQTTELYIGPQGAAYANRDFDIRVSSAVVELETSEFTSLPGIDRHLMVLDGVLEVTHEGHHTCELQPFAIDSFSGDWHTTSKGKVTDFNLMLKRGLKGTMDTVDLTQDRAAFIECNYTRLALFYCYQGAVQVDVFQMGTLLESYQLTTGDVYYFEDLYSTVEVELTCLNEKKDSKVIYCEVFHL